MDDRVFDKWMAAIKARIDKMDHRLKFAPQPSLNTSDLAFIYHAVDDLKDLMQFAKLWQSHQQIAFSIYPAVYAAWEKACEADKPALEEILIKITPMATVGASTDWESALFLHHCRRKTTP